MTVALHEYDKLLENVELFKGIKSRELHAMLTCVGASMKKFPHDAVVLNAGDEASHIGIVLSGEIHILKDDAFGHRNIIGGLMPGDIFGEAFVCAGIKESPVSITAVTEAEVLFLDYERAFTTCSNTCSFHVMLIQNMMKLLAQKNLFLNQKIDYLSIKNLRARIAAYLLSESERQKSDMVSIPFNRNDMADFLGANRSALSRELSRMRDDGLIEYWKNSFKIIDKERLKKCSMAL